MPIRDYSTSPASNTSISGIGLSEGVMTVSATNDAIRQLMADVRELQSVSSIASSGTTNIGAANVEHLTVSGTTTITAFDNVAAGTERELKFDSALTLTHNATSLILPGGASITTAAGDVARFRSLGSGNWRCVFYTRAAGTAVGGVDINGLTTDSSPDPAADYVPTYDASAAGNKKVLLANLGTPTGTVLDYAGSTEPTGWLFCYGQAVSRTTYAALFAVISTTYGSGDGSTTFNLPDLRGRVTAGRDNMGGSAASRLTSTVMTADGNTLGATGGTQTHTLTEAQMPAHTHSVGVGGSGTTFQRWGSGDSSISSTGNSGSTGSGQAHLNTQPTMILNKIIKT